MTNKTKKIETPALDETPSLPFADDKDNLLLNALAIGASGVVLKRITCVSDLLKDKESLIQIIELASTGASVVTIEIALGFPPGILAGWLKNGLDEQDGPFYAFRQLYLKSASVARHTAEAALLNKNPEKWLEKYDPLKDLNPDHTTTIDAQSSPSSTHVEYKEF